MGTNVEERERNDGRGDPSVGEKLFEDMDVIGGFSPLWWKIPLPLVRNLLHLGIAYTALTQVRGGKGAVSRLCGGAEGDAPSPAGAPAGDEGIRRRMVLL